MTAGNVAAEARRLPKMAKSLGRVCVMHTAEVERALSKLAPVLTSEHYEVIPLEVSRSWIAAANDVEPDLVIVLAGGGRLGTRSDLVHLCETMRQENDCRIIVVLEAGLRLDEEAIIDLLDHGADDVIPSEMGTQVLLARVRVALRNRPSRRGPEVIVAGDVVIDLAAHAVLVDGNAVNCPPRQFDILVALASKPGALVLRDALITDVWRIPPASVQPHRVRVAVSVLRRLMGTGPRRPTIQSVSHIGYRLVVPT